MTLDGITSIYSVIQPKEADTCMLINGTLESADLNRSWFSLDVEAISIMAPILTFPPDTDCRAKQAQP